MNKQPNQEFEEDYFTTTHNIEVRLKSPFQSYVMNMAKFFATYFLVGGLKLRYACFISPIWKGKLKNLMPNPSASSKTFLVVFKNFDHV